MHEKLIFLLFEVGRQTQKEANELAKQRRDKTASSRELRYLQLEIFEIRLRVFVGNY